MSARDIYLVQLVDKYGGKLDEENIFDVLDEVNKHKQDVEWAKSAIENVIKDNGWKRE